ncbi:hypothetical protein HMPREF9436_02426 [Faecalibacterium cf. prausnitzii KLE1255]|uniref:Uncharacterized protein n=1 Tax=Faecalibacterium cf. prausnitzii KLE1255 TaxID=748224 RepID=E2ZL70_9FIRM|nr:hypothetical protein HMPREF9436_02426 [Faecalibacterium cf. prausnitzii KLE1255]
MAIHAKFPFLPRAPPLGELLSASEAERASLLFLFLPPFYHFLQKNSKFS